ncbi:tripartite tricarboxylate transporter substrate-binding protein [Noviherbaspirillum sp. CPCC 100848]|uniref:Tripartite tricarboxylate transporter substrate-binding protein n=1 Tax=Noviherbaspirillum album TaxID=3080276 RepID=A0ABU6JAB1_9BURK|nr:tripartite tricarboxylate transporter substrate-binding protein [Noviherbaspirillum sp. CPCC 100848]MEC4720592.1 tripartite tricarboxylate transporter substrate-binding protein [Noviherbaspirillum sp. CPCC 100848]
MLAAAWCAAVLAASPATARGPECVVPAKPGGGMDLTCKLARKGLSAVSAAAGVDPALQINYLPGGIGAVAWNSMLTQRRAEADTLVVFSGGSLLNLAQGKYGNASAADMRWVAALGADYGMIAVRSDSPYKTLADLLDALKRDAGKISIGAGGTAGSQDWLKVSIIARQAGIHPKKLRFVAFEGGGESITALLAGHVQAVSGDASEAALYAANGGIRVLAVMSDRRLPGVLSGVPTAREQGFEVTWPIVRGFYMGPGVPDAEYRKWVGAFDRMMKEPGFDAQRAEHGLYPFALTGDALTTYVRKTVDDYGRQAKELGLSR